MSDNSKIEWCDATWNPLVGCSRVSAGCLNCYAERHAYRFSGQAGTVYEGTARLVNGRPTFTGRVNFNERVLDLPLRWKRPRRIFVNSMSDLFHESVPDATIDRIFAVMALSLQHTFQVLTKRPERMREYFARELLAEAWWEAGDRMACELRLSEFHPGDVYLSAGKGKTPIPLLNVWLGVSVEDQAAAEARIALLLKTPAAVRFLSCEPLLGPIDLTTLGFDAAKAICFNAMTGRFRGAIANPSQRPRVDWIIAGGESGPRANPMHPDWARSLRDQCVEASVPFFFKQWGEWLPIRFEDLGSEQIESDELAGKVDGFDDQPMHRVGKKAAGRLLDGVEHNAFPERCA